MHNRTLMRFFFIVCLLGLTAACSTLPDRADLNVAAAASLSKAFTEIAEAFEHETNTAVTLSFGATGQLAQQIRNGAPFDLFAAADMRHIDLMVLNGDLEDQSRMTFARGSLVLVAAVDTSLEWVKLEDLNRPEIRRIAIANPSHAPYGIAALEALIAVGLWEQVEPKILYAETVQQAATIVSTGNAEVGIIARSNLDPTLRMIESIPPDLHEPILHTAAIAARSERNDLARSFLAFLVSAQGRAILQSHGLSPP